MPRPVTKGPNIQFRLPVDLHAWVEEKAATRNENVPQFVERNLTRILRAQQQREAATE